MATNHQFNLEAERKQGIIRNLKLEQLQEKVNQESYKLNQEKIKSEIELVKTDIQSLLLNTTELQVTETEYKLNSQESKVGIARINSEIEQINLLGTEATKMINEQKWRYQLENENLEINKLATELNQKRELYNLQGNVESEVSLLNWSNDI